jgi:membrane protein DedA with SNARE-associated domain
MDWETVKQYVVEYGYIGVGVGTLIDQSGLQSFVVAGGVIAQLADDFHLLGVVIAGTLGSLVSDLTLWAIGRWRADWLDRIVRSEKGRARLKVLELGIKRRAFLLLAAGRLMPWIGRFVPAAAGLRRVPFVKVLLFAGIGALASAAGYACIGYFAAGSVTWLDEYAIFIWLGALAVSIPIAALLLKRFDKVVMRELENEVARAPSPAASDSEHP